MLLTVWISSSKRENLRSGRRIRLWKINNRKAIVGLEKITSGEVIYEGQDVTKRSVRKNELQQGCSNDFSRFYVKSES